jgi:mono/diheme cytochrome c family protein
MQSRSIAQESPSLYTKLTAPFCAAAKRFCDCAHLHFRKGESMKHLSRITLGCIVLAATAAVGQTNGSPQQSQPQSTPKAGRAVNQNRGQQVYEQNCSRCHNAPTGFSSTISGTVARHMRVRANLSEADYKALLRFFNP